MLKTVDYALIWRKDKRRPIRRTEPTLWEIRIFYKGQEARVRPLHRKATNLNVVKKDDGAYHVQGHPAAPTGANMSRKPPWPRCWTGWARRSSTPMPRWESSGCACPMAAMCRPSPTPSPTPRQSKPPNRTMPTRWKAAALRNRRNRFTISATICRPHLQGDTIVAVMDSGLLRQL
jgi:hypothetical protein